MLEDAQERLISFISALWLSLNSKVALSAARRGISTLFTLVLIVVIIIGGVAIIFVLIFFPGGPSITTTYP